MTKKDIFVVLQKYSHWYSVKELRRLVHSARKKFFQDPYQVVSSLVDPHIMDQIEACLEPSETGSTLYDWIKSPLGQLGMKTILEEVKKLGFIFPATVFAQARSW